MRLLANVARLEMMTLFASFAVVTLWKLCQSVSFAGLLRSRDGTLSPGRVQLFVVTVLTALQYLLTVIHDASHLAAIHDPSHLAAIPPIPANLVWALGGSQVVYLGGKAWSMFGLKRSNMEKP
jgi:hypothetical protein